MQLVDVDGCTRCGLDHSQLEVRRLLNPRDEWDHWAWCPEIGQPILLRFIVGGAPVGKGAPGD